MDELIFVSYARVNGEFALKLAKDLRTANVKVWMDQLDIRAGEIWDRAVEDALQRCTGLLVILSPIAVSSRSVMDEVSFALEENKKVVPVLHQTCEIPFRLRRVQRTDFTSDYSAGLSKLIDALNATPLLSVRNDTGGSSAPSFAGLAAHTAKPEDRVTQEPNWSSRRPRLVTALRVGLAGAIFSGAAEVMIHANQDLLGVEDPWGGGSIIRTQLEGGVVVFGGLIGGLLWAVAGVVAGPRHLPLVSAISTSLVALIGWITIFGTYAEGMRAAVDFLCPAAGIVGAAIGGMILKMRGDPE
jgi:hypothetical protein